MTISKDEFEIRGIDACKWVIFFNGMQLPGIGFGSQIEAEFWVKAKVEYWSKVKKLATDMTDICDGSGEMGTI